VDYTSFVQFADRNGHAVKYLHKAVSWQILRASTPPHLAQKRPERRCPLLANVDSKRVAKELLESANT
jgi:hypothetical protein